MALVAVETDGFAVGRATAQTGTQYIVHADFRVDVGVTGSGGAHATMNVAQQGDSLAQAVGRTHSGQQFRGARMVRALVRKP